MTTTGVEFSPMKYAFPTLAVLGSAILAGSSGGFAQEAPQGLPQFVTIPILQHVTDQAVENGHFVFAEGAALPSPLAPNLGTAPYSAAVTSGSTLLTTSTERNLSGLFSLSASYEGETSAAGNSSFLAGFSNHIYPGNCSAGAAPGTVGDCAPIVFIQNATNGTWSKASVSRTFGGATFGIAFDPGVDYDNAGNFYFSYGAAPLSGNYPNGIAVVKATPSNGVLTLSNPVAVTFNRNRFFDDKYYIAVDRTTSPNRIYVSWDRNVSNNQILYIAYSSDGGATWSSPIKVNDGTSAFERVIGAYPAVDQKSGVVYDSWHDYAKNTIFVDKSTSSGVTWATDAAAATTHAGFGTDIGCVGGRSQGPAHALKVGPTGALYLVYADPVKGRGFDILLTKSTNGGATWSAPVTLNNDTGAADQFHPTLSVESNGASGDKITVSFYDRRDDPANCLAHVYATQSTDGGATWSANVRVTSAQSNFDGNPNGPGDYSSSTPFSSGVWPFFSDHRSTNASTATGGGFDVYTAKLQ